MVGRKYCCEQNSWPRLELREGVLEKKNGESDLEGAVSCWGTTVFNRKIARTSAHCFQECSGVSVFRPLVDVMMKRLFGVGAVDSTPSQVEKSKRIHTVYLVGPLLLLNGRETVAFSVDAPNGSKSETRETVWDHCSLRKCMLRDCGHTLQAEGAGSYHSLPCNEAGRCHSPFTGL